MKKVDEGRTLDAGALKALAHPLRVRIYDLLSERGPQTASSLAVLIGETSGATSYHLRALASHDLIEEVPDRGTARERWWQRPKGRINLPGPGDVATPSHRAAAQIVNAEFFRRRHEMLMEYLNRPQDGQPEEWRDTGLVASTYLDLTAPQMEELKVEIQQLLDAAVERYRGQSSPDARRVAFRAELFDLATGPADKGES